MVSRTRRTLAVLAATGFALSAVTAAAASAPVRGVGGNTCATAVPTQTGTSDADQLAGTSGNDVIFGLDGDDEITGLEGNDLLCGGPGSDILDGGPGDDRLFGEADEVHNTGESDNVHWGDTLTGGPGSDVLDPGHDSEPEYEKPETLVFADLEQGAVIDLPGNTVVSGPDTDTIAHFKGVFEDRLVVGTLFDDTIIGTRDDDRLIGNSGDDTIRAAVGADYLEGNNGNDQLFGGPDHDPDRDVYEPTYNGDTLVPGSGADLVSTGGPATGYPRNSISFHESVLGVRVDVAKGVARGEGTDELRVNGGIILIGTSEADVIKGTRFYDALVGGGGADHLYGRGQSDLVYGDNNSYYGFPGGGSSKYDRLYGGPGRDFLDGGPLTDRLFGGPHQDWESDRSNDNSCQGIEHIQSRGC